MVSIPPAKERGRARGHILSLLCSGSSSVGRGRPAIFHNTLVHSPDCTDMVERAGFEANRRGYPAGIPGCRPDSKTGSECFQTGGIGRSYKRLISFYFHGHHSTDGEYRTRDTHCVLFFLPVNMGLCLPANPHMGNPIRALLAHSFCYWFGGGHRSVIVDKGVQSGAGGPSRVVYLRQCNLHNLHGMVVLE